MTDAADTHSSDDTKGPAAAQGQQEPAVLRLETRLARAEAQILALQESFSAVLHGQRNARHRALMIRLAILVVMLGAFFYMRAAQGGAG